MTDCRIAADVDMIADFNIKSDIGVGADYTALTHVYPLPAANAGRINQRCEFHIGNAFELFDNSFSDFCTANGTDIISIGIF